MDLVNFSKAVGTAKRCPECGMKMERKGKCRGCGHESKESMKHERRESKYDNMTEGSD